MSKLSEKLASNEFVITAELFPPKGVDVSDLMRRADIIGPLVDAINITDNQRASMRLSSISVCRLLKERGYEPIMQMTCRDRNRIALQSDLLGAYVLGIENVLILSGDHNQIGEYREAKGVYDLDSIQLIKTVRHLEEGFDLAGKSLKGSPRYCLGAVVNPTSNPVELQTFMMAKKIAAGAQFFQTQPIFDIEQYKKFYEITKNYKTRILPGVILIKSMDFARFLMSMPGVNIPQHVLERIEKSPDYLKEGIKICAETITQLKRYADGVHIMAIGMEEYIPQILEKVE